MMPVAVRIETENQVEAQIVRFLLQRGWIVDRIQVGLFYTKDGRPMPVGRPGQPDWRANHAKLGYLEVEVKSTTGRLSQRQQEYLASRQAAGRAVTWANSLEMFERWYEERYGQGKGSAA